MTSRKLPSRESKRKPKEMHWIATKQQGGPKPSVDSAAPKKSAAAPKEDSGRSISVRMATVVPGMSPWLPVTSKKTGYRVFVPLPIRLIHQIPDSEGGGCIVRGVHGDEATAKESIVQILDWIGGFPLREGASSWVIAD